MSGPDDLYQQLAGIADQHERTDDHRTIVLFRFDVADFDQWRAGYQHAVEADSELLGFRVWRGQDDPNRVVLAETFGSRSYAEAAVNHPATREAMARDGIDLASLEFAFLDEAEFWSR